MSPRDDTPSTGTPPAAAPEPAPPSAAAARRPSRWWGITGGVLAAALVIAVTGYSTLHTAQQVTATTIGYKVLGDTSVRVSFDVSRPSDQPVTCTIQAMDGSFSVVGSAQLAIPTGGERTVHQVAEVRTASRAVTGNVTDCVRT